MVLSYIYPYADLFFEDFWLFSFFYFYNSSYIYVLKPNEYLIVVIAYSLSVDIVLCDTIGVTFYLFRA